MANLGTAVLELRTDLRPLAAGVKEGEVMVAGSLQRMEAMTVQHMSRIGATLSQAGTNSRQLAMGHGDATGSLAAYATQANATSGALRGETRAANDAGGAMSTLSGRTRESEAAHSRLAPSVARSSAGHRALKNDVEQAGYAFSGFTGRMGALGRSLDLSARHAQLFKSQGLDYIAAGLASGAVALIAYGTKANITFDNVGKSIQRQAGTSREVTGQLLNDVRSVGEQAPESWQKIGDAVAAQYRLFGSSNAQIKQNTDLFLAFAHQANMDVVPAITAVSNVFRLFHPAGMSAVDVMDQLVNLSQKTQRPLGDLLGIINKYGPQFQAMGLSFTETVGLMQAFSAAGVDATGMSRGLSAAISRAAAEQKKGAAASADGGAKMLQYQDAVKTAQMRVDELSQKLASGKGDQAKYSQELGIAQDKLTIAKDKLDQYTTSTKNAGNAHLSITQIIAKEAAAIEGASSQAEALHLALQDFGPKLGPQMALALYRNKAGLDAMDAALGDAHGKTEDLAKAQRDTLHGQLEILHHDFDVLAAKVGITSNGLKGIVGDVASLVKAISSIPTPILDLILGGALVGGVGTLVARHTPLGADVARLFGGGPIASAAFARTPTAQARFGLGGGVGASTVAEMTVGTLIAKSMIGGPGGGLPTKGGTAEKDLGNVATRDAEQAAAREGGAAEGGIMGAVRSVGPKIGSLMGGVMRVGMVSAVAAGLGDVVSHVIGGQAGKAIGKATQWGGLGASIGLEVGGPAGAAIGGAIGVGVGLAVSLIHKRNYGRDIADAVFKNFGGRNAAPDLARNMEDELNKANSIVKQHTRQTGLGMEFQTRIDPAQQAALNEHARKAGHDAMQQLEAGWSQYRFQDPQTMWRQFIDATKKFPRGQVGGQMKAEAAQEMLTYTRELIAQGKLPAGAYKQMLDRINRQFPWWRDELRKAAIDGANAFARNLNLHGAENNVKQSLNRMRSDFPQLSRTMDQTRGDMVTKAAAISKALQGIERQGGPAARQAAADLKNLRVNASRDLNTLEQQVKHNVAGMKTALQLGSNDARNAAVNNVKAMQTDIDRSYQSQLVDTKTYVAHTQQNFQTGWQAVSTQTTASYAQQERDLKTSLDNRQISQATYNQRIAALDQKKNSDQLVALSAYTNNMLKGMENTGTFNYQGMVAIVQQYNQAAKPLGGATIPVPTKVEIGGGVGALGAGIAGALQGHATGGVIQVGRLGEGGHDNVPLNVGGQNILVGNGEQVVVFNRHQIPDVNRRFGDYGGLPGYFAQNRTPNYASRGGWSNYAGGGIVTASEFGGPGDPGTGSTGYRGDDLNAKPDSFAELNMGTALGNLPYGAPITVTLGGRTEKVYKRDIGAGGPGLGGHVRAVDLWYAAANAIGLSGLADVMVNGGAGVNVQISGGGGGGAAAVPTLTAPHADGTGPITDIVNKSFKKATDAANQKLQSLAPVGGFAGGQGTAPPLSGPAAVQAMIRAADWITAQHYPYLWGGGHGNFNGPYDCSGAVSAVLHAAGMISSPEVSGDLGSSYGEAGPGKWVTIYGNPEHVWMTIMGHAFGTSGSNPGGGAGWFGGMSTSGFGVRHPAGLARGGVVDVDTMLKSVPPDKRERAKLALSKDIHSVLPGLAAGGILELARSGYVTSVGGTVKGRQKTWLDQQLKAGHRPTPKQLKAHGLRARGGVRSYNAGTIGTFKGAETLNARKYRPGHNPFSLGDMAKLDPVLKQITDAVGGDGSSIGGGGDAQKMSDLITHLTDLWSSDLYGKPNFGSWNSPADFIITEDPATGQQVAPYISPQIDMVGQQLQQILGYQDQWVGDLQTAMNAASRLAAIVHSAIDYRQKQVDAIRKRAADIIARIKALQQAIKDRQDAIKNQQRKKAPDPRKIASWTDSLNRELRAKNPDPIRIALLRQQIADERNLTGPNPARIAQWQAEIHTYQGEVKDLQGQLMGFVGSTTAIPSSPGGEMGEIQAQLGAPNAGSAFDRLSGGSQGSTGLYQLTDTIVGWNQQIGGSNGDLAQATLQRDLYRHGLENLAPGANVALSAATRSGTQATNTELVSRLQQQLQNVQNTLAVQTASERILGNVQDLGFTRGGLMRMPEFGGSFMREGIVPGPYGTPRLVEAHAGEEISWPSGGSDDNWELHVHVPESMAWLRDMMETEVRKGGQTIRPRRPLPSGGGGIQRGAGLLT